MRLIVGKQPLNPHPSATRARSLHPDPDLGREKPPLPYPGKGFEAELIWHCCLMKCDCIWFLVYLHVTAL